MLSVLRAVVKNALKAFSILIVLVLALYALRQPLLGARIAAEIGSVLAGALDAKVVVGRIGGDWINTIEVDGIEIHAGKGPIRSMTGGSARAEFDLLELIGGNLEAVRAVRVEARTCEVALPAQSGASSGSSEPVDTKAVLEALPKLFPDGARIKLARLEIGRRAGPLAVSFRPRKSGSREFELTYPGLSVRGTATPNSGLAVVCQLDDPGGVAQEFGLDNRIEGGRLTLRLGITPTSVSGTGVIAGARVAGRSINKAKFDLTVRHDRLELPELDLELPGLTAHGRDFVIPFEHDTPAKKALDGDLTLEIVDLEPYSEFLPAQVRSWMPITGTLSGRLSEHAIDLRNLRLVARDIELTATSGALPLDTDALTGIGVKLRTLHKQSLDLGEFGKLEGNAELEGELTGSLRRPKLEASISVTANTDILVPQVQLAARIAFDNELEVDDLEIHGLGKQPLVGSGFVLPAHGNSAPRVHFELSGEIAPQLFRLSGRVDDRLRAQLIRVTSSRVTTTVDLALTSDGPVGRITLAMPEFGLDNAPELALHSSVWLDGDRGLRIDQLDLERRAGAKPAAKLLEVTGNLPFASKGPIDFRFRANQLPLALVGLYAGLSLPTGGIDANFSLRGPSLDPDVTIQVDLRLDKPFEELTTLWPKGLGPAPSGAQMLRVRISGQPSHLTCDEFVVESHDKMLRIEVGGELPVALKLGSETPFAARNVTKPLTGRLVLRRLTPGNLGIAGSLEASLRLDDDGLHIPSLAFRAGSSQVLGQLLARFEPAALCAGKVAIADVPIRGSLDLTRLDLAALPAEQLGISTLTGRADGNLRIGGTLATPAPEADLQLRDLEVKVASIPRMEHISADLRVDSQRIDIHRVKGTIGSGQFSASGNLTATRKNLVTAFGASRLDLALSGTDVLVARTSTIRARCNLELSLSGTPEDIHVFGRIALVSGKYAKRRSAIPDLTLKSATAIDTSFSPFRWASPLGQRVTFERITVETLAPFRVRTGLFDCDLRGQFKLGGTGPKPYIIGDMSGSRGILRLPGARLKVVSIVFHSDPADPYRPKIQLSAEGMRIGYKIYLDVIGPVHDPEIRLTSNPSLPAEDLLVLLTTGYTPKYLSSQSNEANLQLVGTFAIQELIASFSGGETSDDTSSIADRITIETGRELGPNGLESVRAEVSITDKFYLVFERGVDGDYNLRPGFRIRF